MEGKEGMIRKEYEGRNMKEGREEGTYNGPLSLVAVFHRLLSRFCAPKDGGK
jgi:hypothetical protein